MCCVCMYSPNEVPVHLYCPFSPSKIVHLIALTNSCHLKYSDMYRSPHCNHGYLETVMAIASPLTSFKAANVCPVTFVASNPHRTLHRSPPVCPVYRAFAPSSLRLSRVVALLFPFPFLSPPSVAARPADYSKATRGILPPPV